MALLMLTMRSSTNSTSLSLSKLVQDLSVLVAEIRLGAWVQIRDQNYSLFTQATRTIQSVLDSVLTRTLVDSSVHSVYLPGLNHGATPDPGADLQPWDFEMDFWTSLEDQLRVEV
jgi:hypothetical protein